VTDGAVLALVLAHAASTWFMVGVIWFVQIVHYPLFAAVPEIGFRDYEGFHTRRTGALLALPWAVEGLSALALLVLPPPGVHRALVVGGAALMAVVIASTVLLQVPRHAVLSSGWEPGAHRTLVATNWIRTAAWSGRGLVAVAICAGALRVAG
jgi:hypothetical protein